MPRVTKRELAALRPYLEGDSPQEGGEWSLHCPLHPDAKRSASLNIWSGVWYCHAGCGGGKVADLLTQQREWHAPVQSDRAGRRSGAIAGVRSRSTLSGGSDAADRLSAAKVAGWASALLANEVALGDFVTQRGITTDTVRQYKIGWDSKAQAYTIPVYDREGKLINVRFYQLHPPASRRKIWGVTGHNTPRLFPVREALAAAQDAGRIVLTEGELDAIITNQAGFPAITRTGAAKVWQPAWGRLFTGLDVYLCHDCDTTGQDGNRVVGRALERHAREVRTVRLPFPIEEKHGKDLTDFWLEHPPEDDGRELFERLLDNALPWEHERLNPEVVAPDNASVLDAFDARHVAKPLQLTVTVQGKSNPPYVIPREARLTCTRDAGNKCAHCPLYDQGGDDMVEVEPGNKLVLELMGANEKQRMVMLRALYGAPKDCPKLRVEVASHQSIEQLYARPSIEHNNGDTAGDYQTILIISQGRHDTPTSVTVQATGALHPHPKDAKSAFLAWDVHPILTSIDRFEVTPELVALLRRFQPRRGQAPLKKLRQIADELARSVTRIYGRPELHAAMDLVWHSVLSFEFNGQLLKRGWLELLVLGDTRTGKSEVAGSLREHYRAGELVGCDATSFAGLVGGTQQIAGKEWMTTWGVIPLNDRRLVVLDEVGELSVEAISQMTGMRSSGVAEVHHIVRERAPARARMIWMGNPRDHVMADYAFGVQAVEELIGRAEDIARFDLALCLTMDDVTDDAFNVVQEGGPASRYTSEACAALVRWAWSRRPEQVTWAEGAETAVLQAAGTMGRRYSNSPPLIQAANVRIKIARLSVALAACLFSCDEAGELLVVRPEHVAGAVDFVDHLYGMETFGYGIRSADRLRRRVTADANTARVVVWLKTRPQLANHMRENPRFKRQDIEEALNVISLEANAIINQLLGWGMVRKHSGFIIVEPALNEILRKEHQ